MPRRNDIHSILVIGSGPIVIGQACEFDYSGTQACKALMEEGYRVILLNSNPATIMTDPNLSDACYIEPLTVESAARIIEKESPDAILPTVGGQTALNLARDLAEAGVLSEFKVKLIGADLEAIEKAEAREQFKQTMDEAGLPMPRGGFAHSLTEAEERVKDTGFPAIIRPSYTLGGKGSGIAYNIEEYREMAGRGLDLSATTEILVEESIIGWKEYELEVIRDKADNVIIICSIENVDPMGVHTGDSVTVAPAQTLTDVEYQKMRNWAKKVIRAIGVETGGSNVQFAVEPQTGRMVVIEMNPRVSRSSALASKATGFPIARIAAKLAVGYTLDELPNEITSTTPASFEPALDYVVVKIPRWEFKRFPNEPALLGTQMKSVGEAMAIGRTFKEALMKGFASLEDGRNGLGDLSEDEFDLQKMRGLLSQPNPMRFHHVFRALKLGWNEMELQRLTMIDPWFILQISEIVALENQLEQQSLSSLDSVLLLKAKRTGFSDIRIAALLDASEKEIRSLREQWAILPVYKRVDTCAAEFEAATPYMYSTYEQEDESQPSSRKKVVILGGGPNRIGQAIEFDYCCCQASYALEEMGIESIMINCNPETVSTDFDTSDRLYFEPLTFEHVREICRTEKPDGVIIQLGGQTPLKLAHDLKEAGINIIGTSPEGIDLAEDRQRFSQLMRDLKIAIPDWAIVEEEAEAQSRARAIGYPVLIRPSYVLGGTAMRVVYGERELLSYIRAASVVSPGHPVYIDKFLENAFEIDVDAISDGEETIIAGILQHIEEAGIHSGDSAMVMPTCKISNRHLTEIRQVVPRIAKALGVVGLMNIQFAVHQDKLYIIEANPRASRTIPFVSKATGIPFVKKAMQVKLGATLAEVDLRSEPETRGFHVKASVFPFSNFPSEDPLLGPQMRSTGEVMGRDKSYGAAFAKAMIAAGQNLPSRGSVFISVNDEDKPEVIHLARKISDLGFTIFATQGTADILKHEGLEVKLLRKIASGRPNVLDAMKNGEIDLIINTPLGKASFDDDSFIRIEALRHHIPCLTTLSASLAAIEGIEAMQCDNFEISPLQ